MAVVALGLLPSMLYATHLVVVWEYADLCTALELRGGLEGDGDVCDRTWAAAIQGGADRRHPRPPPHRAGGQRALPPGPPALPDRVPAVAPRRAGSARPAPGRRPPLGTTNNFARSLGLPCTCPPPCAS
jgi:hypothetical protein